MFFQQRAGANATLSYLLGCAGHGKAVAVDVVAGDEEWFLEQAARAGARLTHVVDTHVHADHHSGGRELARRAAAAYCLHESNQGRAAFAFEPLADGRRLEAGNVLLDVIHTPGHSDDSVCLLVRDLRRGDMPWFMLTGDTLLVGGVGRPDLDGREREMAGRLYDSLHSRILPLPAQLELYPGHQAGSACGAGLSGKPASTLGFEKRSNALLSLAKAAFVHAITCESAPLPADARRITAANLGGVPS